MLISSGPACIAASRVVGGPAWMSRTSFAGSMPFTASAYRVMKSQMVTPGSKFTRKKEEAIAALLNQRNIEEAAKSIGIGTQTLLRWLKVPEFQTAYREARRAAV